MTNGARDSEDLDLLAGEFVLGTLDDAQRHDFEQRLRTDTDARLALAAARERFLELDLAAQRSQPSDGLWHRIERDLPASGQVVDLAEHRQERGSTSSSRAQIPRRPRAAFWQGFAAASVAAVTAAALAWTFIAPEQPRLIVVLLDADAKPISIVETFDGRQVRIVPLDHIDVPAGKALQVWTLPDRQTGPVSIGLLPSVSATTLEGPILPAPKVDQLYEITLEPAGGSPTGRPTGTIIGKGYARAPQI